MSRGRRSGGRVRGRRADDQAIIDLLGAVREVRTTLAIDLSTAAGALEDGHPDIASDILAATSAELGLVADRERPRLTAQPEVRRRSRRRRALIALPAVPLVGAVAMTAAAALSGAVSHHPADSAHRHAVVQHASASSTLQRLEHVVKHHPRAAQVLAVADALHQQLTQMIATSTNNPAQLHVVQQLLTLEQHVLESSKVPGTQLALAASREIADLLTHHAHQHSKHAISNHDAPTPASTQHAKPTTAPPPSRTQQVPQSRQSTSTTQKSPSPSPSDGLFGRGVFNRSW